MTERWRAKAEEIVRSYTMHDEVRAVLAGEILQAFEDIEAQTREEMRDELLTELRNIATANPATWEPDVRDQFRQWAQNRARMAIAKAEAQAPDIPAAQGPTGGGGALYPRAAPHATPERDHERELRQMFSDGVDVARSYGDNAFHLWGEQLERQFRRAYDRMRRGEFNVQPTAAAPPATPAANEDQGLLGNTAGADSQEPAPRRNGR